MKDQIGNVILDYTYYGGQDQYSDGDIEDDLLHLIQEEPDVEKILAKDDHSFKTRLASRRLDRFDVKRIIQLATHDVVQLCLIDNSLPYLFGTIR